MGRHLSRLGSGCWAAGLWHEHCCSRGFCRRQTELDAAQEPLLSSFLHASILSHDSFERSLAFVLAHRLADATLQETELFDLFCSLLHTRPEIAEAAVADIRAVHERVSARRARLPTCCPICSQALAHLLTIKCAQGLHPGAANWCAPCRVQDPACLSYNHALLHFKGFHAIQTHRLAHELWVRGSRVMALALQSRMSEAFAVDIHPGAKFGSGVLLDHATVSSAAPPVHGVVAGLCGQVAAVLSDGSTPGRVCPHGCRGCRGW